MPHFQPAKIIPFSLSDKTGITEFQTSEELTILAFLSEINRVNNSNLCLFLILLFKDSYEPLTVQTVVSALAW